MAKVKGTYPFSINQSRANPPTVFGLPGQGSGNAAYLDVALTGSVSVYDDGSVRMSVSGTITHPDLLGSEYPVLLVVRPSDWSWTWNSSGVNVPSGAHVLQRATIGVARPRGSFTWNVSASNVAIGQLEDYAATRQGHDGAAWFGGTGDYWVDDPISPDPVRITIPGFLEYLDYFPWARRVDGTFMSCDRAGGSLSVRRGGSWGDVKNTVSGDGSQAHYHANGTWNVCPKIGAV